MRKIEKSIIRKVFLFETKRTVTGTALKLFLFLALVFLSYVVISSLVFQLETQGTFDLLQLFSEDSEILRTYSIEVLDTIIEELPKLDMTMLVLVFSGMILFLTFFFKHFEEIKNKWKSLYHFWLRRA